MSRLRDEKSQDPVLAEAAALLRAVAPSDIEPPSPSVLQHRRARSRRSHRLLGLRPMIAFAFLALLGALASAAVVRWRRQREAAVTPRAPIAPIGVRHHRLRVAANPSLPEPKVEPLVEPAPIAAPALVPAQGAVVISPKSSSPAPIKPAKQVATEPSTSTPPRTSPLGARPVASAPVPLPSTPAASSATVPPANGKSSESPDRLLQSAMRALRFEHDAKRASELADTYLTLYPDDDLVEEAMAIGIEAHTQLDDGAARALAARYLTRFPNGRFRSAALGAR